MVGVLGVDRALRVGADDQHLGAVLLEVAPDAGDRAAGADGDHDRVDLTALGLLPDLGRSRLVVRLGIRQVRVLVGLEAAGDLLGEAVRDRVVRLGRVVVDGGRRDHDLGAVGAQRRDLLLAHLVRHHEDAAVALLRGRDREPDAGVARGRLDDRAAGAELALPLGRLDHREPDAVLVRAARVEELELREQCRRHVGAEAVEPHDRRRADEVEESRVADGSRGEDYAAGTCARSGCVPSRTGIRVRSDGTALRRGHDRAMHDRSETEHRPLCTIELIAEGHAARCPGDGCAFWDRGCVLTRVELELDGRPEVAQLLLDLRGALEAGHSDRARAGARDPRAHPQRRGRHRRTALTGGHGQARTRRRAPSTLPLRTARLWISTRSPLCGAWMIRPRPM